VHTWPTWRGSARAADQARPREDFTAAPPGAPQSALPPACTHIEVLSKKHSRRQGRSRRGVEIGGEPDAKTRAGSGHGSPRRGGDQRNGLVEVEEGTGASISPKVATAMATGVGRRGQATAAAIQSPARSRRGERPRQVWVGLTDPGPDRLG
jgi:hypothetical protein